MTKKKGHKAHTPPPEEIKPEVILPPPIPTCAVSYEDGDSFSGQYAYGTDGRPERSGFGKYTKADGSVFMGQWEKNVLSGPKCYVNMIDVHVEYKGEMLIGQYHGQAEYSCDEYYYSGRFQNGRISGPGVLLDSLGRQWIYPESSAKDVTMDQAVVLTLILKPDEIPT